MVSVAIFDYGAGNIFSLKTSLEKVGATVDVITNFDQKNTYSGLLLQFQDYVGNMPVLGICLGMEMFFAKSEEGKEKGLNVIDGEVVVLPPSMKVPHMGWNDLEIKKPGKILEGVKDGSWAYFVHSYRVKPDSNDVITAESDYGIKVPAVVEHDNFFGTQFHPEKSSSVGKIMLGNFLKECRK
jgi:glutamine amidotransferase